MDVIWHSTFISLGFSEASAARKKRALEREDYAAKAHQQDPRPHSQKNNMPDLPSKKQEQKP